MDNGDSVWLEGERGDVAYLFDVATGRVLERRVCDSKARDLAGYGVRCSNAFVALYVQRDRKGLVLQVDSRTFPLDGQTSVQARKRFGGFISELVIARQGQMGVTVRQRTIRPALESKLNPLYDGLDELWDDQLGGLASIAGDAELRRENLERLNYSAIPVSDGSATDG